MNLRISILGTEVIAISTDADEDEEDATPARPAGFTAQVGETHQRMPWEDEG